MVTNSVENLSTQVKENADGLKVSVKKDELGGDVARLLNDKTNLLLGTRNFSGDSWSNKTHWHEEPGYWKGLKVFSSTEMWSGLQYKYEVKQGQQYTFSFWARQEKDNSSASIVLSESDKGDQGIATPYVRGVHIGTEWKRYSLTFQAESDGIIYPRVEQNVQGNKLYIAGYKLELGSVATPWEPNEADVAENIEHNESQFNVYSDQIAGIVKKQEKMGDTERQLDTRITETAEGLKQTSKDLQDANGKITEFKGQLESTARGLKTEYEKYTNEAIGQISDSSLNLIHNSAFSSQDNQFESWQNISAKATVREDSNNLHWVELTQSGQGTDNPIGVTSNYFIVKQGKVTVAVDVKLGDKANLDNQNILLLELYDESKKRVDFTDVSVSQLGLSMSVLNDHNVHRGLYRLGIDRKDVKYMTVKAILHRNGDLWLTNFSARLSSIDDGGYTPNPDDVNHQILKMNTKIEEDAEHIALKANSVDVTRDIKDAVQNSNGGGVNLLQGTAKIEFPLNNNGGTQTIQKYDDETNYIQHTSNTPIDRMGPWCPLTPEIGQVYTLSADVCGNGYIQGEFHYEGGDKGSLGRVDLTNDWQRISNTFRVNTISGNWTIYANNSTLLKVKHIKIERGSVATPWTPAVEDTSAEIKSAKDAAIQVASDQINLHVNELSTQFDDKLNKRVNEVKTASEKFTSDGIEQTVTKITDVKNDVNNVNSKLDNLRVGGRNLFALSRGRHGFINPAGNFIAGENDFSIANIPLSGSKKLIFSAYDTKFKATDDSRIVVYNAQGNVLGQVSPFEAGEVIDLSAYPTADHIGLSLAVCYQGNNSVGNTNISQWLKDNRYKLEIGTLPTDWSPAPEDIDQTIKDATEYKTVTGTIDFNNLKTQQKIFYKDSQATNTPAGGNYWYYLDVEPGDSNSRIIQTAVSDRDNIAWVRTFVDNWGPWIRQADQRNVDDLNNQISSFKTETTASVKNLGGRVTTEVNSITTRQDNFENEAKEQHSNDVELVRKSDFEDGSKGNWTVTGVVPATNPAPPAELGQSGMKVLQTNTRDGYEDGIWYSVKPGEKFDVDYWCAPSPAFHTTFGLVFADKDKQVLDWGGINSDQSGQWKHYTGTITAPANAAFAKAWYQMEKPANNTENSSWIAKPHIRRQNPQVAEKISELNTKWDVANGQIQGKVTETDVNNILNGKGYATQSWAQSNFRMKSDSIDLEVKKITDPISDKINNLQVGGRNLVAGTGQDTVIDDTANTGTRGWCFWVFNLTQQPKVGDQITVSSESTLTGKGNLGTYEVILYNSTTTANRSNSRRLTAGKRSSATLEVTNLNGTGDTVLLIYAGNIGDTEGKKNVIHHLKVELGNVATDWSPAPEDTTAEIKSAKDTAINVANDKVNVSSKELQGKIDTSHKELQDKIDDSNKELQGIKDITQWHTVSGPIDLNDLKTQTRIFYRDIQDKNSAVTGWQYIVIDSSSDKVTQTVWKDNSTIQYIRQFTGAWSNWVRQTNQNDIDEAKTGLREEIKSAKDAAIQVASDQINIHVNELSTQFDDKLNKRINEQKTASEKFTSDGIEQVVTKVTNVKNDVDRLGDTVKSTGSRNLLHNTSDRYKTLTGNDYLAQSTASDIYTSTANYHNGDWFTYAATITNNSSKNVTLETWLFDQNKRGLDPNSIAPIPLATHSADVYPGEKDKRVSTSFQISGATWFIRTYVIFDGGGAPNGSQVQVKDERLVEGKLDGSWSPNPDDINRKIDTQTLDSANIDDLRTQGHYFVKNLIGNPISGWVYVDVMGIDGRLRQDVYQDDGSKHMYRRLFGNNWSGWEQGAYLSDVNNVKTEVTASVKNLGDRVTTEVNSVTSRINTVDGKVNNMQMGGRNLLKGTRDFDSKYWYCSDSNHSALADNPVDSSVKEIHSYGDWASFRYNQTIQLDPNKNYMISADIAVYGNDGNGLYITAYGNLDGVARGLTNDVNLAGFPKQQNGEGFKRVYLPLNTHGKKLDTFRIEGHGNWNAGEGSVFISKIALYEGNTPMAWSDASDDFVEAIKEVNTKWDVANGQIQGKVTETQVNNILNGKGYATQSWAQTMFQMKSDSITLQAVRDNITNGIQNQVANVKNDVNQLNNNIRNIGTRNLLHNTSDQWRTLTNNNGWLQQTTSSSCWTSVADYHGGDKFTYAAKITNNSHQQAELEVWLCDQNKNWINGQAFHAPIPKGANAYDVSVTFPITADTWYIRSWIIFTGGQAPNGDSVKVKDERLVEGATPGSWSPNPDDINQQITNTNNKIDTQTLDSANIDQMKTQGHYFVKNLTGDPIGGWVYVDVTGNNNDRLKQEVYQDNGYEHRSRRWYGSYWTEWTTDVNNKNVISQINITPDQIKIASNKIVIDGNTDIHGTLRVPEVKLQGKSGYVDLSGDGINIAKNNGAGMNIGANAIQITSNTNGQAEVEGVITPAWSSNNVNQNGIGLILTTKQELGGPYGGDILTIGTMPKSGVIHSAMVFDATGITGTYNRGFNWFAPHTLNGDGGVFRFPNAQDDLVAYAGNIPGSRQAGYSQPTLALVHGRDRGSAGLQFQWDDLVPFGRINSSNTRVSSTAGSGGITVSWYSWGNWWGDMKAPAIVYVGDDGKYADGGIVFYPGGEVCVWHQQFRSYLQYGGLHQTD